MARSSYIEAVSNELEFSLEGVSAQRIIAQAPAEFNLMEEVNPKHVVEMNVSLLPGPDALNRALPTQIRGLRDIVVENGGKIYGGGAVLEDVSDIEPNRKRTTSLSDILARGFLSINGQQVVLGMTDERRGLAAYEALKTVTPFLLALSLATPYRVEGPKGESLVDTGAHSLRPDHYTSILRMFPERMWRGIPSYNSLAEFRANLQGISDEVNRRLAAGELDTHPALWENGYANFKTLEPHQIYHATRIRPDHDNTQNGGRSLFTLEVRTPDMPQTLETMQAINALVYGVAYRATQEGVAGLNHALGLDAGLDGQVHDIVADVGRRGLDARYLGGRSIREQLPAVVEYALRGLVTSGDGESAARLLSTTNTVMSKGTEAERFRAHAPQTPAAARAYLSRRLDESLERAS